MSMVMELTRAPSTTMSGPNTSLAGWKATPIRSPLAPRMSAIIMAADGDPFPMKSSAYGSSVTAARRSSSAMTTAPRRARNLAASSANHRAASLPAVATTCNTSGTYTYRKPKVGTVKRPNLPMNRHTKPVTRRSASRNMKL